MRRIVAALLFVFSLICCFTRPMLAQEGSATLTGFIQDSSKAVIPGVKVTAIEINTNEHFEATTGKDGSYTIVSLPVGPYQMQIEKPGFKTILKDDLFLHTQDALEINFQMAVGSTSETVTVNGTTTKDSPAVSLTVTREFIESMPLNGRSFQDLIQLAPGAVSAQTGYYSIDGQRTDGNNYTVDGVSANMGGYLNADGMGGYGMSGNAPMQTAIGTTQSLVSVDSLQEFTIQTSGYTAEYGRTPGGQVQFTTRSGNNNIHGTLFEYLRNTALDANSDSNDYFGNPKTAEHQNDFGGTIGGPLVIPRFYQGKNKTFYFLSYEGLRLLLPSSLTEYVPTQAFRGWASTNVQPFINAQPLPNTSSSGNMDGCTIPNSTTGQLTACDALFYRGYSTPSDLDNISIRVDHSIGSRFHGFLRYADTPSYSRTGLASVVTTAINTHSWTAGLTANITKSLLDDLRFNSSRDGEEYVENLASVAGAVPFQRSLLIPAAYENSNDLEDYFISVPGTSLSFSDERFGINTAGHQYQVVNSLAWSRGKHAAKAGIDWRRIATQLNDEPYKSIIQSTGLTSLQQGYATYVYVGQAAPTEPVLDNLSVYGQDHWLLVPRLSIDYGLRWELNPPPGPANGLYPAVLNSNNLAVASLAPLGTPPYKTKYNQFAPRFGFAWNAISSQKHPLTVRGGFGIFYDTGQAIATNAYEGYPFVSTAVQQGSIALPLSPSVLTPPQLNLSLAPPYSYLGYLSNQDLVLPYTEQWSVSLDEALSAKNTLTLSYVGNNGRKLLYTAYLSKDPFGNQNFPDGMYYTSNASQSSYNAFQVQDSGRIVNGLDVVGSFTWAHALDNDSTDSSAYFPLWGNSNYDLRRVLNLAINYKTRAAGGKRWSRAVTSDWLLANRFATQSGYPVNIIQSTAYLPGGEETEYYPNLIPHVPIYLHGSAANIAGKPVSGSWRLNKAAFGCTPTSSTISCGGAPTENGDLGRNYIRTASFWAFNTALERSFSIYDQLHLNFRLDAFNILNHPNLTAPDTFLTDSTFGEVLDGETNKIGAYNQLYAMGAARSLQLSLKLQF